MATLLEVIHVMLALALIGIVLIQKSEGGGLGIGGGGMSGFMTGRGQANLLTRTTAFLFGGMILTSLTLTWLHATEHGVRRGLLDRLPAAADAPAAPESAPAPGTAAPAATPQPPAAPAVPLAK